MRPSLILPPKLVSLHRHSPAKFWHQGHRAPLVFLPFPRLLASRREADLGQGWTRLGLNSDYDPLRSLESIVELAEAETIPCVPNPCGIFLSSARPSY